MINAREVPQRGLLFLSPTAFFEWEESGGTRGSVLPVFVFGGKGVCLVRAVVLSFYFLHLFSHCVLLISTRNQKGSQTNTHPLGLILSSVWV